MFSAKLTFVLWLLAGVIVPLPLRTLRKRLRVDETGFFEELAQALLVDRLAQEVVHTGFLGLLLVFLPLVRRYAANKRLGLLRHVLVQVLFDPHGGLDASALWHAVVEKDEFVGVSLSSVPLFYPVHGLVAIGGRIALDRELHKEALERDCVERVVVDDEDRRLRMPVVLLVRQHQLDCFDLLARLPIADGVIILLVVIHVAIHS